MNEILPFGLDDFKRVCLSQYSSYGPLTMNIKKTDFNY